MVTFLRTNLKLTFKLSSYVRLFTSLLVFLSSNILLVVIKLSHHGCYLIASYLVFVVISNSV